MLNITYYKWMKLKLLKNFSRFFNGNLFFYFFDIIIIWTTFEPHLRTVLPNIQGFLERIYPCKIRKHQIGNQIMFLSICCNYKIEMIEFFCSKMEFCFTLDAFEELCKTFSCIKNYYYYFMFLSQNVYMNLIISLIHYNILLNENEFK